MKLLKQGNISTYGKYAKKQSDKANQCAGCLQDYKEGHIHVIEKKIL